MYGVDTRDMYRIANLPVMAPMTEEGAKAWTDHVCNPHAWSDPKFEGLRRTQAESIAYFHDLGGVVVPLRVSAGKALIAWACATLAINHHGSDKCLVIVPAKTLKNFCGREQKQSRAWLKNVPRAHQYQGRTAAGRMQLAKLPGIHIISEGLIQSQTGRELIRAIGARSYVIDEAHNFSNFTSARTKRILGLIDEIKLTGEKVQVAVLSASMTTAGIARAWKLYQLALNDDSPLPITAENAHRLGQELDPTKGNPPLGYTPAAGEAIADTVVDWAVRTVPDFPHSYTTQNRRHAVQLRMQYAPGVVMEFEKPKRTPTVVINEDCGPLNEQGQEMWDMVENGITPSGDEISSPLERARYWAQLSAGFYIELVWPTARKLAARRRISVERATELIEAAKLERELHNAYNKRLRETLTRLGDNELDTPHKMGMFFQACGGKPGRLTVLYSLWKEWKDFSRRYEGELPERDRNPILVDDYKIRNAVTWAERGPGLLWVYHDAPFHWTAQYLRKAGVPFVPCDSGDKKAMAYLTSKPDPSKVHLIRLGGYGEGIELDFTHRAHYLEWRRSAKTTEQSLGRIDRSGQKAAELEITTNRSNSFDLGQFSATIAESSKDRESSGAPYLLLESRYDPPLRELTSASELARLFEDYRAGDVNMQQVLRSLKS